MTVLEQRRLNEAERAFLLGSMHPTEAALHRQICRLRGWPDLAAIPPDELTRELYVTAFPGAYGTAGHVVTLNGSPPRFVAVVLGDSFAEATVRVLVPQQPAIHEIGPYRPVRWQPLRRAVLDFIVSRVWAKLFCAEAT